MHDLDNILDMSETHKRLVGVCVCARIINEIFLKIKSIEKFSESFSINWHMECSSENCCVRGSLNNCNVKFKDVFDI